MTGGSDMAVVTRMTIMANNSAIVPEVNSTRTWLWHRSCVFLCWAECDTGSREDRTNNEEPVHEHFNTELHIVGVFTCTSMQILGEPSLSAPETMQDISLKNGTFLFYRLKRYFNQSLSSWTNIISWVNFWKFFRSEIGERILSRLLNLMILEEDTNRNKKTLARFIH